MFILNTTEFAANLRCQEREVTDCDLLKKASKKLPVGNIEIVKYLLEATFSKSARQANNKRTIQELRDYICAEEERKKPENRLNSKHYIVK